MNDVNPTQTLQWFYRDFPGGDLALVGVFVLATMFFVLWKTRNSRYSGPATLVTALAALCLAGVTGFIHPLAVAVMLLLALLTGVFLNRWSRIR